MGSWFSSLFGGDSSTTSNTSTTTNTSSSSDSTFLGFNFDSFLNFDWVNNITLATFFPPYVFAFPTGTTELILVAAAAVGGMIVEVTSNLSAFSRIGYEENQPDSYSTNMLCLDALGEMLFGVLSIVLISLQYSYNTALFYWLALLPTYFYQSFYGLW